MIQTTFEFAASCFNRSSGIGAGVTRDLLLWFRMVREASAGHHASMSRASWGERYPTVLIDLEPDTGVKPKTHDTTGNR